MLQNDSALTQIYQGTATIKTRTARLVGIPPSLHSILGQISLGPKQGWLYVPISSVYNYSPREVPHSRRSESTYLVGEFEGYLVVGKCGVVDEDLLEVLTSM